VAQARIEIRQAEKALAVARANFKTARSLVEEAVASRKRAGANYERWKSESGRMDDLARQRVIDSQSRDEALNQLRAAEAAQEEAQAQVRSAEAGREESAARRDKAEADVEAARNCLELAEADRRRVRALVDYARITAPFAGVVSDRTVDTGHLLQPASGSGPTAPLFVVERTDRVRVFLEVPEGDPVLVREGLPARIRVQALNDAEFVGKVAGCSWSLEPGQHTLRTEIDFDNREGRLRPGMYAHAVVEVEQPDALTLPWAAVPTRDGQTFCFRAEGGKAAYTPVKVGARQRAVVEVLKKQQRPARPGERARWVNFTGRETVILTNPAEPVDGQAVQVTERP
jgi:RND family efflux transporter MFP subunit